jgi:hypothetical protein
VITPNGLSVFAAAIIGRVMSALPPKKRILGDEIAMSAKGQKAYWNLS